MPDHPHRPYFRGMVAGVPEYRMLFGFARAFLFGGAIVAAMPILIVIVSAISGKSINDGTPFAGMFFGGLSASCLGAIVSAFRDLVINSWIIAEGKKP